MGWDDFDPRPIARDFWGRSGFKRPVPERIEEAISLGLPVATIRLPKLTIVSIRDWLESIGATWYISVANRPLQGCLLAQRGHGLIFISGALSYEESRFTLAHEAAHFLYHYIVPREKAIASMGQSIVPVLDGDRPQTSAERLSGVLRGIPIGTYQHLLDREAGTNRSIEIDLIEAEADLIAMELLAPASDVAGSVSPGSDCFQYLTEKLSLPKWAAETWHSRIDSMRSRRGFMDSIREIARKLDK